MLTRSTFALALGFAVVISGCSEAPPPPAEVVRPIKIFEVPGAGPEIRREYPGTIKSEFEAEVGFEVPGRVVAFDVEEGQVVEPGQVVAKLDTRDLQTRLDKAIAQQRNARADLDRAQGLLEQGVLAAAERDHRLTSFEVAEADAREARKALDDATLVAPVRGTIARKLVRVGESVQAKQSILIFQAEAGGALEIEVAIPEREIATGNPDLSNGDVTAALAPQVILPSVPDRSFPATVTALSTRADPSTRTFQGTLTFQAPPDLQVLPGMTAKVSVRAPREFGEAIQIAVPSHAVAADAEGRAFVWSIDPTSMAARRTLVEVGVLVADQIEIRSGLQPGQWVAASGIHQLREGMVVSRLEP